MIDEEDGECQAERKANTGGSEKLAEVEAKYKEQMRRMSDEKDGALAASVASAGREADEISDRITAELEEAKAVYAEEKSVLSSI